MPLDYSLAATEARIIASAEYQMKYVYEPVIQRLSQNWISAARYHSVVRGIAQLRTSSLLLGSAGLVTTLVVPLGVWAGVWAAMGAPYIQARALVKKREFTSGFTQGFVMSLLSWEWQHVVSRFFRFSAGQINPFDESIAYVGANAYNEGLRAGYMHALFMALESRTALRTRLKELSPGSTKGNWTRLDQINYVIELAAAGINNGVFQSEK